VIGSRFWGLAGAAGGGLALVIALGAAGASCQSAPTPTPLHSFDLPGKVAAVCLHVYDAMGVQLPLAEPLPLDACPPVPLNTVATTFQNHLFALVTQTRRGALAAVDLTAGSIVDESRSTPGVNFIPVGSGPTDVTVSPDAQFTFVSTGFANNYAVYAIPNEHLLGDWLGDAAAGAVPLGLGDLRACHLPQPPVALGVVPLSTSDPTLPPYAIVAALGAFAGQPASVVTLDPRPFMPESAGAAGAPQVLSPGIFGDCTVLGSIVSLTANVPAVTSSAATWPDGVPYADAGDPILPEPPLGPTCATVGDGGIALGNDGGSSGGSDASPSIAPPPAQPLPASMVVRDDVAVAYVADGSLPLIHVIQLDAVGGAQEVAQYVATSVTNPSQALSVGQIALSPPTSDRRRYLYAIDATNHTLMVFDATAPIPTSATATPLLRPHAVLNPFAPPDRIQFSAPVQSIAFTSHDWPLVPPQVCGPGGGCVANPNTVNAYTGLACNPNLNALADGGGGFVDGGLGGYYRADFASTIQPQGIGVTGFPTRLRGVFAFAALANGNLITIDVDDWDAPCRRPDPMAVSSGSTTVLPTGMTGVLDIPEPAASGPTDLDPYHAPYTVAPSTGSFVPAYQVTGVTEEQFFPVSAPNRMRSSALLRNDPATGNHTPNVSQSPSLRDPTGATFSSAGGTAPIIAATSLADGFIDPSTISNPTASNPLTFASINRPLENSIDQNANKSVLSPGLNTVPRIRVSFDDPTAQIDQDWTVIYEGSLPAANNLANLFSSDGYQSLTLTPSKQPPDGGTLDAGASNGAKFCAAGIEDWNVGQERVAAYASALRAVGLQPDPARASYTGDYVEITDDLLPSTDGYWQSSTEAEDCWTDLVDGDAGSVSANASARYNFCLATFGTQANADTTTTRDFPIVFATDNTLTLGRFAWPEGTLEQTTNRTIVAASTTNTYFLKRAACCFHKQAGYKVRAGGEWVTVGLVNGQPSEGFLHHNGIDPTTGECTPRCDDPTRALLNARTIELPPGDCTLLNQDAGSSPLIDRNSPLAMRNPMFSFVMWGGCPSSTIDPDDAGVHTFTPRDLTWTFSMRGGFVPVSLNLAGTTGALASPQSMLAIGPFGQLAIIDGSQQGLLTIDLNTMGFAHTPYF
jgi:hypothetical protein